MFSSKKNFKQLENFLLSAELNSLKKFCMSAESKELEKLRLELDEQKKAYQNLLDQQFVNIFHQPGSMFNIVRESYGTLLQCKLCKSKGGTRSLSHSGCQYTGTQVWYQSYDDGQVTIYDVAMFDSSRRN